MLARVIELSYLAAEAVMAVAGLFRALAYLARKASRTPLDERASLGLVVQFAPTAAIIAWVPLLAARLALGRPISEAEFAVGIVALSYGLLWSFERLRKDPKE